MKKLVIFINILNLSLICCKTKSKSYTKKEKTKLYRNIDNKEYEHKILLKKSYLVLQKFSNGKNENKSFLSLVDLRNNRVFIPMSRVDELNNIFSGVNFNEEVNLFIVSDKVILKNILQKNYLPLFGGKKKGSEINDCHQINYIEEFYKTFNKVQIEKIATQKKKEVRLYKQLLKEFKDYLKYKQEGKKYNKKLSSHNNEPFNFFIDNYYYVPESYEKFDDIMIENLSACLDLEYFGKPFSEKYLKFENYVKNNLNENTKSRFIDDYYYNDKIHIFNSYRTKNRPFFTLDRDILKLGKFSKDDKKFLLQIAIILSYYDKSKFSFEKSLIIDTVENIKNFSRIYFYKNFKKEYFDSGEWIMIDCKYTLKYAEKKVPKQCLSWTCGLNSVLRALTMQNIDNIDYQNFISRSPKYICEKTTEKKCVDNVSKGLFATLIGTFAMPFNPSLGVAIWAGGATTVTTSAVTSSLVCDVGPSPAQLRNYINNTLYAKKESELRAYFFKYDSFGCFEDEIISCIKEGNPCIVLIIRSADSMHYVNIVGIKMKKGSKNIVNEFGILDTDKTKYSLKRDDFRFWTKNSVSGVLTGLGKLFKGYSIGEYNLIKLKKNNK